MSAFHKAYLAGWVLLCLAAACLYARGFRSFVFFQKRYWRFLLRPWKAVTFLLAAAALVLAAPYNIDPTWDRVDAAFISVLTFLSAPGVVGILDRARRMGARMSEVFVACCLWLFSASWSYDLYILLRDGAYPQAWLANLVACSVVYFAAGLFWSLDWSTDKGIFLAFLDERWPLPSAGSVFRNVYWAAVPIMILVALLFLPFLRIVSGP
ncbi:MAG: hypothetical protein ABII00_16370 [Elusimicrobiota bacterium]